MVNEEIAYQNKDIVSKIMAEKFRGKSFAVYGIDIPKIKDLRPTNLPVVEANELRLDNLFLLEDESYALVDYESDYREEYKCEYLKYLARVTERLYNELKRFVKIRMIIIYTADVEAGKTRPVLDLGGLRVEITEGFLSAQDPADIWDSVSLRIERNEELTDEDMMRLVVYPLTFRGNEAKQDALDRAVELAGRIEDRNRQIFVLKMLLAFSDKFITDSQANRVREEIGMTKVEKIIAEEMRQLEESVTQSVTESTSERIALNLLRAGSSPESVAANAEIPLEKVLELQAGLASGVNA